MGDMNYNPYEHNPHNEKEPYKHPLYRRGNAMETAAMVLGVSSLVMCNCLYIAIPFGALAILFALLSRGAKMEMGAKARNGLILGIVGIVVTIVFYAYAFYIAIQDAGSFENLLREACEMMGYDFETLFGEYFQ